jgi:hypothetical protein
MRSTRGASRRSPRWCTSPVRCCLVLLCVEFGGVSNDLAVADTITLGARFEGRRQGVPARWPKTLSKAHSDHP